MKLSDLMLIICEGETLKEKTLLNYIINKINK